MQWFQQKEGGCRGHTKNKTEENIATVQAAENYVEDNNSYSLSSFDAPKDYIAIKKSEAAGEVAVEPRTEAVYPQGDDGSTREEAGCFKDAVPFSQKLYSNTKKLASRSLTVVVGEVKV